MKWLQMGRCCGQSMSIVVSLEYRIQGSPGYCCTIPVLFQFRFVSTIRPARRIFVRNRKGGHVSVSVSTPDKHWPKFRSTDDKNVWRVLLTQVLYPFSNSEFRSEACGSTRPHRRDTRMERFGWKWSNAM
jgi:hypothetical protein